ncbi:uncharacterized protein LOC129975050 isoform X2 [Argiope bruennichi]|uniref:uncharacterized protein LOC129975050 isoform X2 n=1 Tax=Argiope bruennichi TaxID=94029 RepID=UPI0024940BE1|nr:uncharacterized protein LOC129975050 isoform X2 [Argiope bruennichi]
MFPSYFPMDTTKRCLVCVVFIINCVTFALICTAMLTQEWVIVKPVRTGLNISIRNTELTDVESSRFQGVIYFGLFNGKKILNYGFGDRSFELKIVCVSKLKTCMYSSKENSTERVRDLHENFYLENGDKNITEEDSFNDSLPDFNSWIVTVSSLSLAAMFAITGGAFAIVNAIRNSAEMVFGFLGILIWNSFGFVSGAVSIFSWILLYFFKFRRNVMTREELEQHWVSEFRSCVGFSFYLVVLSTALFVVNVGIISTIIKQPWVDRRLRAELRKKLSSGKYASHSPASSIAKKPKSDIISV